MESQGSDRPGRATELCRSFDGASDERAAERKPLVNVRQLAEGVSAEVPVYIERETDFLDRRGPYAFMP